MINGFPLDIFAIFTNKYYIAHPIKHLIFKEIVMPKKAGTVLSHWYHLIENIQHSPKEFYTAVEEAIGRRQIPDVSLSRVDHQEGGVFSASREYLRVQREELVFDVCSAHFGTGFFVSWWLGEARPSPLFPTLTTLVVLGSLYYFVGLLFAFILSVVLFFILGAVLSSGSGVWAAYLLVIPFIGPLFEKIFMPPTYYKKDNALMFLESVRFGVHEALDQITQAKGLRSLTESERKPILNNLFKR